MFYNYFLTRTRANGTRTVYGVIGEDLPTKKAGGYLQTRILWDDAFPEDIGLKARIYKPSMEQKFEAERGVSYDVSATRPKPGNFGEAAHRLRGPKARRTTDHA